MKPGSSFLTQPHEDEFVKPGRRLPRFLVEPDAESSRRAGGARRELVQYVSGHVKELERREGQWLDVLCIRVTPEDGMSWSAEAVSGVLVEKLGHYAQWRLSKRASADKLPAVARLVGVRTFLRLAARRRLTHSFVTLRWWLAPLIAMVAIVLSVAAKVLDALLKSHATPSTSLWALFTDSFFLVGTTAAVLVGLSVQQLITFLTTRTKSASTKAFAQDLDSKTASTEYGEFVEDLARLFAASPFPRAVVVDNFEALDPTTKAVMLRYFQRYATEAGGSEFWTIFELVDGDRFTSRLADGRAPDQGPQITTFTQALLTYDEKRTLARLLGRDEAAAVACQVVKCVAHGDGEGAKRWRTIFAGYRPPGRPRPTHYDLLDVLYLMSLTAESSQYFLSDRDLVNDFADSRVQRAEVLRQLLPGTKLNLGEFRQCQEQIAKTFGAALVYGDDGRTYQVSREATEALRAMSADVPPAGLAHLFWALFWYDRLAQAPREAFWMRKLAHHGRGMNASLLEGAGAAAISSRALDMLAFTADGCLRTGLFGEVRNLLRKAVDLLRTDGAAPDATQQNRLLRLCWDAYWILGDSELLTLASEIYDGAAFPPGTAETSPTALERLFLEMVPLRGGTAVLRAIAGRLSGGAADVGAAVLDHAAARSAWLALTVMPFMSAGGTPTLGGAVLEAATTLEDTGRRIWNRLATTRTGAADGITLLAVLWTTALRARWDAPGLSVLIALGRDAVLVAGELRGNGRTTRTTVREVDFPLAAMARELCAVAIAAITATHHAQRRASAESPSTSDLVAIDGIVTEINRILGTQLPAIATDADLRSPRFLGEIDRLLLGCEIVWHTFGLLPLRNAVSIRRAQFNVVCFDGLAKNVSGRGHAFDAVRSLDDDDAVGLMANLAVADRNRGEPALAAYFLRRAGQIALQGRFGRAVRREMAFVVVMHGSKGGPNLSQFVDAVLRDEDDALDDLSHVFRNMEPDRLLGVALRLLEESRDRTAPDLEARCRSAVRMQLSSLPEAVRRELGSILEAGTLRDELLPKTPGQPEATLTAWGDRRGLWPYAWMLDVLLKKGYGTPDVLEGARLALTRSPDEDVFNAYLLLALTLAELQPGDPGAIAYLKGGIPRWEHELPPGINIRVFAVLEVHDPANQAAHRARKSHWEFVVFQLKQLHQLPALLDEGRFFDVFDDYCAGMREWGLRVDASALPALGLDGPPPSADEAVRVAVEWLERGAVVPSPWHVDQTSRGPSLAFVLLGRRLFSAPLEHDPRFAEARQHINDDARHALPDLLKLVLALPRLPVAFKDLVVDFNGRFQSHAARDPARA